MMQQQPGFLRYTVARTGPDSIVSLSAWETRAQSDTAAQQLVGWVKEHFGPDLVSVDNQIGEVVLSDWSGTRQPGWGRVSVFTLNRPVAALISMVRDGYVPLIRQQAGFNSLTIWQTGEDACITYNSFDSKKQGEAGLAVGGRGCRSILAPT